jgi:large subunit ribosomal protein L21
MHENELKLDTYPQLPRTQADYGGHRLEQKKLVPFDGFNFRRACGEVKLGEWFMQYAIVESGGKQYKTVPGGSIEVDRLSYEEGKQITLDQVLLVAEDNEIHVGTPIVKGASVEATVTEHFKGRKIVVFKYKPRKRYRRKYGHRQRYTRLQIDSISMEQGN